MRRVIMPFQRYRQFKNVTRLFLSVVLHASYKGVRHPSFLWNKTQTGVSLKHRRHFQGRLGKLY